MSDYKIRWDRLIGLLVWTAAVICYLVMLAIGSDRQLLSAVACITLTTPLLTISMLSGEDHG